MDERKALRDVVAGAIKGRAYAEPQRVEDTADAVIDAIAAYLSTWARSGGRDR